MASAPLNKIERAHQMYRDGQHREALGFYTEALSMAKTKAQRIALHSNRAACFLKLQDLKQAAEECSSVLELDHKHTGALMLRAQTLVTLKEYHSALFDVNQLLELNPSSEVYQNLQARLRTQLSLAPIPECGAEVEEDEEDEEEEEDKAEADDHKCEGEEEECGKEVDEKEEEMADTEMDPKTEPERTASNGEASGPDSQNTDESSDQRSIGWQAIPKPKGHTNLDYSRWDKVQDDSSDEEDDDEEEEDECQPKYRFRVRTVGVRPVK